MHIGEPMRKSGFVSRMSWRALARFADEVVSQWLSRDVVTVSTGVAASCSFQCLFDLTVVVQGVDTYLAWLDHPVLLQLGRHAADDGLAELLGIDGGVFGDLALDGSVLASFSPRTVAVLTVTPTV